MTSCTKLLSASRFMFSLKRRTLSSVQSWVCILLLFTPVWLFAVVLTWSYGCQLVWIVLMIAQPRCSSCCNNRPKWANWPTNHSEIGWFNWLTEPATLFLCVSVTSRQSEGLGLRHKIKGGLCLVSDWKLEVSGFKVSFTSLILTNLYYQCNLVTADSSH